jgi:hypothetical protein
LGNKLEIKSIVKNTASNVADYVKCSIYNRATFAGYLCVAGFGVYEYMGGDDIRIEIMLVGFAFSLLKVTKMGRETFESYRQTKSIITANKMNEELGSSRYKLYCNYGGIKLAVKEAGLENLLTD